MGDPDWDMFEVVTAAGSETQLSTSQVPGPVSSSSVPSSVCVSQVINPAGESKEETGWFNIIKLVGKLSPPSPPPFN